VKRRDAGISELIDEFLLIGLLLVIAIIILSVSFGFFGFLQKSAYVVPDFGIKNISGHTVIAVFHRAGDPVYFTNTTNGSFQAGFYVDTITGTYPVKPVSSLTSFIPGQTIYVYSTGSGFAAATNLSGITFPSLPQGIRNLRLVDLNTHVLIAQMNTTPGGAGTAATTATATMTATTSPTPSAYAISISWTPRGAGANAQGTISPPGTNDATVNVLTGASQTFTFTPAAGYRVRFIMVDGVQVSSGGAVNQVLTYTLSNIHSAHTVSANFG
jgi:hypothetical protein